MKILIIPDVHLKPQLFTRASSILQEGKADSAVCLMDLPDDWNHEFDLECYEQTFDAAIQFAKDHPQTLWCWGNHDLSYVWGMRETGYSWFAQSTVSRKLIRLVDALPDTRHIAYIHRIDDVLFLHGGLADVFVRGHTDAGGYDDIDAVLAAINRLDCEDMWNDDSPVWFRPQYCSASKLYKPKKYLQVVGHTPMETIDRSGNLLSCDVFSTYRDGTPIGPCAFPVVDTERRTFEQVK